MKLHWLIALAIVCVPLIEACTSPGIYTRKEYMQMSDKQIESVLIRFTPIGSSKQDVESFIKKKLKRKYFDLRVALRVDLSYFKGSLGQAPNGVDHNLSMLISEKTTTISAIPGKDKVISAYWHFDKDNRLIYIEVTRGRIPS